MISHCRYFSIRIDISPITPLPSGFSGVQLRSALGRALHELSCTHPDLPSCEECPEDPFSCPYRALLETPRPPYASLMKKYPYVPHPIVITPFLHDSSPGFDITGIGPVAFRHADVLLRAISLMGRYGMGKFRYSVTGQTEITPRGGQPFKGIPQGIPLTETMRPGHDEFTSWHVVFETPTVIKHRGHIMSPSSFSARALMRAFLFRLSLLLHFHCPQTDENGPVTYPEDPLGLDYASLLDEFSAAELSDAFFHEFTAERFSARQGRAHPITGFTGSVVITSGGFSEIAHLLPLARIFHVGKFATYGFGRVLFAPLA